MKYMGEQGIVYYSSKIAVSILFLFSKALN